MFRNLPTATRHLLLINLLFWLADILFRQYHISLSALLGLHYVTASDFHFWQPVTYMFMHADLSHIFCNMFAVWMFAPVLEREWGTNKFLVYYFVCGIGAAIVQETVWALHIQHLLTQYTAATVALNYTNQVVTIGASGAVFGILFAFGWLFPDVKMFLLFLPIPIRARTFVIIYAVIELLAGFSHIEGDNVAHFAHLGGMLFGYLLMLWWQKGKQLFKWHHTHSDTEDDDRRGKDFSDYHYQQRIDE
ncbi:MAG: rhomboid family intramembrane serine protease [Paludibacteraceae bacterium]|nr:rhomboid family intramembrane serine protease [Paludibacteraceae bacterium]